MIYFDEAGNSGPNLFDKDQPTYLFLTTHGNNKRNCQPLTVISGQESCILKI